MSVLPIRPIRPAPEPEPSEADRRDSSADDRDREADQRDRDADQRDKAADARDAHADEREIETANQRAGAGSAVRTRRRRAMFRHDASTERHLSSLDLRVAASDRRDAMQDRQAATFQRGHTQHDEMQAVAAHGMLSTSASVVMGLGLVLAKGEAMGVNREEILRSALASATSVHSYLFEIVQGGIFVPR